MKDDFKRLVRDPRIDLFRGIALSLMLVDHIELLAGVTLLSSFTLQAMFWFDAADIFIFLSGLVCGSSFQRRLDQDGFWSCQRHAMLRAARLYLVNLLLLICMLVFVEIASHFTNATFYSYRLCPLPQGMLNKICCVGSMMYQPAGFDILVLYIQFVLLAPFAFWLWRESRILGLILIGVFYLIAQTNPELNLPQWPTCVMDGSSRYFNHFAWQALFLGGLYISANRYFTPIKSTLSNGSRRMFEISLVLALILWSTRLLLSANLLPAISEALIAKRNLGILRVLDFATWVIIANQILTVSMINNWRRLLFPIIACGKHSLVCFVLTQVLSYAVEPWIAVNGRTPQSIFLWNSISLFVMIIIGVFLDLYSHQFIYAIPSRMRKMRG